MTKREMVKRCHAAVRALVNQAKSRPCADCGVQYPPCVMQFDHIDPRLKLFTIGLSTSKRGRVAMVQEISKCRVVCANCHALRTYRQTILG